MTSLQDKINMAVQKRGWVLLEETLTQEFKFYIKGKSRYPCPPSRVSLPSAVSRRPSRMSRPLTSCCYPRRPSTVSRPNLRPQVYPRLGQESIKLSAESNFYIIEKSRYPRPTRVSRRLSRVSRRPSSMSRPLTSCCYQCRPSTTRPNPSSEVYHRLGQESIKPTPRQQQGEQELATKMLQIQSKRFYLDVKQNRRGRFIKVAEIGADGRRSQIFLALSTAAEFRDHLSTFSDFYASLGPPNPENVPEDGKLKSEMMIKDNRRYYLDLKENSRGRFLRVSQTITRGGPRSQIAIPAQGMIEFRDALTDLLEEFGTDDGGFKGELPEGRHMRVENKNFYFDIGQNNRGIYMRISEVKTNFRTAITVPEKSWARFRDIFADYCEKMKEGGEKVSVAGGQDGGPNTK